MISNSNLNASYEELVTQIEYLVGYWNTNLLDSELQYKGIILGETTNISDDYLYIDITEFRRNDGEKSWSFSGTIGKSNILDISKYHRIFFQEIKDSVTYNTIATSPMGSGTVLKKKNNAITAEVNGKIYESSLN